MKTKFFTKMVVLALLSCISIMYIGCTEEGPAGPAGLDGNDGTNGINGTDGKDGLDGYGAVLVTDQAAYNAANGLRGGILYDNWTKSESGITGIPSEVTDNVEFFRCKACHAWDGLGTKGSYINRPGNAKRPNCANSDLRAYVGSHNIKETFNAIKNTGGRLKSISSYSDVMPDYGTLLSDNDVWDLVKYLFEESINVDLLYDYQTSGLYPTGTIVYSKIGQDGVEATGDSYYSTNCASCHGTDGKEKDLGGKTLGNFGRTKPNELWHKVKFGQLGSSMTGFGTSLQEMKDLYVALQDTVSYPD